MKYWKHYWLSNLNNAHSVSLTNLNFSEIKNCTSKNRHRVTFTICVTQLQNGDHRK
jgi:hypothetical protein